MSKKELVPEIRFKHFDSQFEENRLGNLVNIISGESPSKFIISDEVSYIKVDDLNSSTRKQSTSKLKVNMNDKAHLVNKNSVIFPKRGAAIITNKVRILGVRSYMDTNMMALEPLDIDSDFLLELIQKEGLYKIADTSTIPQINNKHIEPYTVSIPSYEEQEVVGKFFEKFHNTIELKNQELNVLKNYKKTLLQKMFPKEGETVPEVRFEGFNKEWEITKLDDVAEFYSGGTPSVGNKKYYKGNIPFIRSAEINKSSTELYISEVGLKNSSAKMVDIGTILYALYGATSGEVGISKINGAINQAILAIKPSSNYDSNFIMQWLKYQKNNITDKYLQGGQGNLSGSIIKKIQIMIPSLSEQKLIGEYFYKLDQNIQSKQAELDKLKQFKQAMLDKMFV